jgi:Flp pilus assembly pilin Flp
MKSSIVSKVRGFSNSMSEKALYGYVSMRNSFAAKMKCTKGASTVEYALVIGVIVLMIIGAGMVMEGPLKEFFKGIIEKIKKFAGV